MKTRIATAIVLCAIFLLLMWTNIFFINFIVFAVIFLIGVYESQKLFKIEEIWFLPLSFVVFLVYGIFFCDTFVHILKFSLFCILAMAGYIAYVKTDSLKIILPFLYPITPLFIMFGVYSVLGNVLFVWMIVIVACCDSGAYFIGKAIGKNKFSPTSPNKTIEGAFGGLVCAIIIGTIFGTIFTHFNLAFLLQISFLVALFSVFGDLFESYLKRLVDVKDSGNILPGHGGVLDRLDGYLFGCVAMFLVFA